MAKNTDISYRNQVMYSVYVRNYSAEGTFEAVRRDLARIQGLGVDILWLMPIHPIGVEQHKGSLGCPYAIRDYRAVNSAYGTLDDFRRLVDDIHARGMKCIIDVVYNHTSPDSWLAQNHPEWFYHKPDGSLGNRVGDWGDVVDLDYSHPELWDYQIETLKYWAQFVDGFRCDVAPLVPLDFWLRARAEVETVRPGCFWLAESVEYSFVLENRAHGIPCLSDGELYQAFDACYDYDIFPDFQEYLAGYMPKGGFPAAVNRQEATFPENYIKLRYLENHDRDRAAFTLPGEKTLLNWTALLYFQKGLTLLYMGQEVCAEHTPSLFEREPVEWHTGRDLSKLMQTLAAMKKDPIFARGQYQLWHAPHDILLGLYTMDGVQMHGIFSTQGASALVRVTAPDGCYRNLIDGGKVEVRGGQVSCKGMPIIFQAPFVDA